MKKEGYILLMFLILSFGVAAQIEEGKITTDSSIIETKVYPNLNSIRIFNELNNKDLTYYQNIYLDTKQLKTKGIFKEGDCIGIWDYYSDKGELVETRNFVNGEWTVTDEDEYPNYVTQKEVLEKAKQIMINLYGQEFYENNLILNLNHLYKYSDSESENWCERMNSVATRFLIRYDMKISNKDYLKEMIEFSLDNNGKIVFPFNLQSDVKGFQKVESISPEFLSKQAAVNKLIELDLLNNNLNPNFETIIWKYDNDTVDKLYNGHFEYSILYETDYVEEEFGIRNRQTTKFISYNFNFWTGDYIGSSKMKSIYEYGEHSGFSTGLIEDK